jgi:predicted  nucleic acid-binding Zn-ribbon protein
VAVTVFEQLLALQDLDLRIHQLRHRRANLPELAAIEANAAEQAALVAARAEVAAAHKELVRRQHLLEDEIAQVTGRAAAHEANLYSGSVTNPRELQAMQDDIDSLHRRQRTLEDQDLEIMEELEPLAAQLADMDAAAQSLVVAASALQSALEQAASEIDAELIEVTATRSDAAAGIDDGAVAEYEQLRVQLGGIAIARLVGSACGGCHLSLPAVELDRIRRLDPDTQVVCEECGRILVR